jgi:hypothetical protein
MIRFCPGCQQSDESPRHVVVHSLAPYEDADFHYGCHARMGCPLCLSIIASASNAGVDHTDGEALTAHLHAGEDVAAAHIAAGGAHL